MLFGSFQSLFTNDREIKTKHKNKKQILPMVLVLVGPGLRQQLPFRDVPMCRYHLINIYMSSERMTVDVRMM